MAGPTVKEVLVKWGIDTSSWKTAVQQISKMLDDQNKKSKQASDDAIAAFDEQASSAKDLLAVSQKVTAEIKKQDTALAKIGAQYDDLVDKAFDQISAEKAITAELQKQMGLRKSVTSESTKTYKTSGVGPHKQVTASFGQQHVFVSSMKAVMQDLESEVDKLFTREKLVTKEFEKQADALQQMKSSVVSWTKAKTPALKKPVKEDKSKAEDYQRAIAQYKVQASQGLFSGTSAGDAEEKKVREDILDLLTKEIDKKIASGLQTKEEIASVSKLIALKAQYTAKPTAPPPKPPPPPKDYERAIAQYNLKLATGSYRKEEKQPTSLLDKIRFKKPADTEEAKDRREIVALLTQEIDRKQQSNQQTLKEINDVTKLARLRQQYQGGKPPARAGGGGGGGGERGGGGGGFFSILGAGSEGKKAGGGNFLEGLFGGFASKMAGTIGFAILSAEGLGRVIERLYEQLKDLILESDKFVNIWKTFDTLAQGMGVAPAEFMEKLTTATHGLVSQTELARQANQLMLQGVALSSNQIIEITKSVSDLARATGKDATQAQQQLTMALSSGRLQTLAYSLELEHSVREQLNLTSVLPENVRLVTEFQIVMAAAQKQLEKTGPPIETVGTAVQRANKAFEDFKEAIAIKSSQTEGGKALAKIFNDIAESLSNPQVIEQISKVVGEVMGVFREWFGILQQGWELLKSFFDVLGSVGSALGSIASIAPIVAEGLGAINKEVSESMQARLSGYSSGFGVLVTMLKNIAKALNEVAAFMGLFARVLKLTADSIVALTHGDIVGALSLQRDYWKALIGDVENYFKSWWDGWTKVKDTGLPRPPSMTPPKGPVIHTVDEDKLREKEAELENYQYKLKLFKEEAEIRKLYAERSFQEIKSNLDKEKSLYDELYKTGALSLEDSVATNKRIREEETKAEIANLETQKKAQLDLLDKEQKAVALAYERSQLALKTTKQDTGKEITKKEGTLKPKELEQRVDEDPNVKVAIKNLKDLEQAVNDQKKAQSKTTVEFDNKELAAKRKLSLDLLKEDYRVLDNEVAAYKTTAQDIEKIDRDRLAERKQVLEDELRTGEATGEEYLQERVLLIEEEYKVQMDAAQKAFILVGKGLEAQAQMESKQVEAAIQREKALTDLLVQQWQIRTKAAEDAFDHVKNLFEQQVSYGQEQQKLNPLGGRDVQESALQNLIKLTSLRLDMEQKTLSNMDEINADWMTQYGRVLQTKEQLIKYNVELQKARDTSSAWADTFSKLSKGFAQLPTTRFTGFVSGFEAISKSLEDIGEERKRQSDVVQARAAKKAGMPTTPEGKIFMNLQKVADSASKDVAGLGAAAIKSGTEVDAERVKLTASSGTYISQITATQQALKELTIAINDTKAAIKAKDGTTPAPAAPAIPAPTSTEAPPAQVSGEAAQADKFETTGADAEIAASVATAAQKVVDAFNAVSDGGNKLSDMFKGSAFGEGGFLGSDGLSGVFKNFGKDMGQAGEDANNFMKGMSSAIGATGGLISAAQGKGGPLAAGLQGAASGAKLGMMVGGPIGGVIGAGAGLITGVFAGKARKQAEKLAKDIVAQFNAALQNLNMGTQSLSATIQLEIQNIQEAVTRLSGRKGGRDELKNIIPNMEQQLAQLQQQQKQIIQTFDEQLNTLNAPQAYQDQLTSIDNIIQKYQQYIQAGGNVANANEYLRQSYANLVQNGLNTLNQDEQDAINNALNYNDLLVQRQQLIQDTNIQMQQIMSQGVAVRQMPEGVSRAIQLQKLAYDAGKQLDSMNAEISVAQHKLNVEQQIFGLATTRIGLENQLVVLQNAQTDQDMKRIVALGQVVGALQTALPTSNQAALQELGLGGAFVSPKTEPGLVPVPPVKTGIADVDLQNQLQYQQALAAYQLQLNYPIGYISPTGAIPTTSPIPSTIGLPTNTLGGSAVYLSGTGMYGTAAGGTANALALAQQAAANAAALNQQFNTTLGLGSTLPTALPGVGAGTPLTPGSLPSLTTNGEQIETISTTQGNALLVSLPPEQIASVVAGPGTTQRVGIVGTAQQVAAGANNSFNALVGAMNKATTLLLPPKTPVVVPSPVFSPPKTPTGTAVSSPVYSTVGPVYSVPSGPPPPVSPLRPVDALIQQHSAAVNAQVQSAVQRHTVESGITQMSNLRVVNEAALTKMKMTEIHADMQRIAAHTQLLQISKGYGASANTLEDLMQNIYETRGRQGFGGFYGETANPV